MGLLRSPSQRLLAIIQESHTDTACQLGEVRPLINSQEYRQEETTHITADRFNLDLIMISLAHTFLFISKTFVENFFTSFFSLVVSLMASFKSAIVPVTFLRFCDASV